MEYHQFGIRIFAYKIFVSHQQNLCVVGVLMELFVRFPIRSSIRLSFCGFHAFPNKPVMGLISNLVNTFILVFPRPDIRCFPASDLPSSFSTFEDKPMIGYGWNLVDKLIMVLTNPD